MEASKRPRDGNSRHFLIPYLLSPQTGCCDRATLCGIQFRTPAESSDKFRRASSLRNPKSFETVNVEEKCPDYRIWTNFELGLVCRKVKWKLSICYLEQIVHPPLPPKSHHLSQLGDSFVLQFLGEVASLAVPINCTLPCISFLIVQVY